jgi:hypothetical protein
LVVRIFPTFEKYLPIAKVIWGFGGLFDAASVPAGLKFDRGEGGIAGSWNCWYGKEAEVGGDNETLLCVGDNRGIGVETCAD